jgi:hypothetical protein
MTGFRDCTSDFVFPVTIDIMSLLGHKVAVKLDQQTDLDSLLESLSLMVFTRHAEAKDLNLDHFENTPIRKNISPRQSFNKIKKRV